MSEGEGPDIEEAEAAGGDGSTTAPGTVFIGDAPDERRVAPGTVMPQQVTPGQKKGRLRKALGTIMVSSSSKARARIRVCEKCGTDNASKAKFCEKCGADLLAQEEEKRVEASLKELEKYAKRTAGPAASREEGTVHRRTRTPPMGVSQDPGVEKKSYHSQYLPPGAAGQMIDHTAFRSDMRQQYAAPPGVMWQQVPAPGEQPDEGHSSLVIGIVLASVLFVVLAGLIATIVVLALK